MCLAHESFEGDLLAIAATSSTMTLTLARAKSENFKV